MGKGFNNYMCKKFFHPASRDNLKRVWMAEQQAEAYKKKQEELRVQYEKEQDLHNNKALLSKESKDKLSVNFMYEPPPGAKKEREKEDNEPEYKFEWQRKYNAPRESYCKGDSEIRDQPFGIQVRNVRCIKCHKWGHINTDKECPLYSQAMSVVMANNNSEIPTAPDALTLVRQMREDGLALKKSALSAQQHLRVPEHEHLMVSDDEEQSEATFLKALSKKEKKKLLRKLQHLERKTKEVEKKKFKKKNDKARIRDKAKDKDKSKGRDKDRVKSKSKSKSRSRSKSKSKSKCRPKSKSKSKSKSRSKSKSKSKDKESDSDTYDSSTDSSSETSSSETSSSETSSSSSSSSNSDHSSSSSCSSTSHSSNDDSYNDKDNSVSRDSRRNGKKRKKVAEDVKKKRIHPVSSGDKNKYNRNDQRTRKYEKEARRKEAHKHGKSDKGGSANDKKRRARETNEEKESRERDQKRRRLHD